MRKTHKSICSTSSCSLKKPGQQHLLIQYDSPADDYVIHGGKPTYCFCSRNSNRNVTEAILHVFTLWMDQTLKILITCTLCRETHFCVLYDIRATREWFTRLKASAGVWVGNLSVQLLRQEHKRMIQSRRQSLTLWCAQFLIKEHRAVVSWRSGFFSISVSENQDLVYCQVRFTLGELALVCAVNIVWDDTKRR